MRLSRRVPTATAMQDQNELGALSFEFSRTTGIVPIMANFSAIPGRPLAALGTHRGEIPALSSAGWSALEPPSASQADLTLPLSMRPPRKILQTVTVQILARLKHGRTPLACSTLDCGGSLHRRVLSALTAESARAGHAGCKGIPNRMHRGFPGGNSLSSRNIPQGLGNPVCRRLLIALAGLCSAKPVVSGSLQNEGRDEGESRPPKGRRWKAPWILTRLSSLPAPRRLQ